MGVVGDPIHKDEYLILGFLGFRVWGLGFGVGVVGDPVHKDEYLVLGFRV